jgi:hypothetical protein
MWRGVWLERMALSAVTNNKQGKTVVNVRKRNEADDTQTSSRLIEAIVSEGTLRAKEQYFEGKQNNL